MVLKEIQLILVRADSSHAYLTHGFGDLRTAICQAHLRPSELVTVAFFLALALRRLDPDFFVVLLERREVLTCLGELALLHALSDVPMHEGSLRIHEVELVINAGEDLGD